MSVIDDIIESEKDYEVASEMHVTDWRADRAAAELAALRKQAETSQSVDLARLESLRVWSELWAHIEERLGNMAIPNESNFDALLAAYVAARGAPQPQSAEEIAK